MRQEGTKLTKCCPPGRIHMRVIGISNHFIIGAIRNHPLVLAILRPESVNKLLCKLLRILLHEELRSLVEGAHPGEVIAGFLMLIECVLVFALFLTHLAVELVLSQRHASFHFDS